MDEKELGKKVALAVGSLLDSIRQHGGTVGSFSATAVKELLGTPRLLEAFNKHLAQDSPQDSPQEDASSEPEPFFSQEPTLNKLLARAEDRYLHLTLGNRATLNVFVGSEAWSSLGTDPGSWSTVEVRGHASLLEFLEVSRRDAFENPLARKVAEGLGVSGEERLGGRLRKAYLAPPVGVVGS